MDLCFNTDRIPEHFDKWGIRYPDELFSEIINYAGLGPDKSALELGPGVGQGTEPILKTGCSYLGIETGENLTEFTKNKFSSYNNFQIVNADFELFQFGAQRFDLVYSVGPYQWIPGPIRFPRAYSLLNKNGTLACIMAVTDEKGPNEALYNQLRKVSSGFFMSGTIYKTSSNYSYYEEFGFSDFKEISYQRTRILTAEEYYLYIENQYDLYSLREHHKTRLFDGIKEVISEAGGFITLNDYIELLLARKA